jgi:hypothetical protein
MTMKPKKPYRMRVENKDWVYEEAVVKHLIRRLELSAELGVELWKEHKENDPNDFGRLTLSAFCRKTSFPVWLASRRLANIRQLPLSKLLCDFRSAHMGQAFLDAAQAVPAGFAWSGLIFPAPGTKFMALHTYASKLQPGATRLVIPQSKQGVVVLEPLCRLLAAIGPWRPQ